MGYSINPSQYFIQISLQMRLLLMPHKKILYFMGCLPFGMDAVETRFFSAKLRNGAKLSKFIHF